jgi:hypothetical protein
MFLASFSAISFGFITIIPRKTIPLGILAISQPSAKSITGPRVSCFASLWPIFLGLDSGSIHSRLLLEYYSG